MSRGPYGRAVAALAFLCLRPDRLWLLLPLVAAVLIAGDGP